MTNKIIKSCFTGIAITTLTMGVLRAQDRIKSLDRMFYTINPTGHVAGPIYRDMDSAEEKSKYGTALVSLILKEANGKAKKYLEAGDTQAYYAFLALSLTVPLHEGLYVHFRNVDGDDVCRANANNGELAQKGGETVYKIFNDTFKVPGNSYFPNCEDMNKKVGINQIIHGADGTDLSVMQVSIRWHFDDFLANKKYENVQETISYGLQHLLNGFDPVYRNVGNYKCIYESPGFMRKFSKKSKINYINLIRGVWAGKYNSGTLTQTCRFADSNSPFKNHDIGFAKNLDKIIKFDGTISPGLVGDFMIEGHAGGAIKEIVSNLTNNLNNRTELDKLLNSNL